MIMANTQTDPTIHTRADLFARLDSLKIQTTTRDHTPVYTVDEARLQYGDLPGAHCKNLFLKDKKGGLWLVVTLDDRVLNMKELRSTIGSHHLSFAKPELLMEVLGVEPGSVTPFALINDTQHRVNVVLDSHMIDIGLLNYHPLKNNATTAIASQDLLHFIHSCGHQPRIINLG
jgi:Ala-tRNA(Pro) deacylase